MTHEELKYKEQVLRGCFKEKLEMLDVNGCNDMCTVKQIKIYGALWHYVHQLCLAEEHSESSKQTTSADTMNIQATGLKMAGSR